MTQKSSSQFILYQTDDGQTKIEVRLEDETVWLTQMHMADLFQTTKQNIGQHLNNVFSEGELSKNSVVKNIFTTASDGKKYDTAFYNLDAIISVGYRVKSHVATRFRQWATQHIREYIIKGFVLDDKRLKEPQNDRYFEELLARIRDIRSSEKMFWRKVLDIYATSIDYDPTSENAKLFFKNVQNQMHWAAHGHTAAEVIYNRADAKQHNMGITNYPGKKLLKRDVEIAKNYLNEDELNILNRIVTAYLEIAELQALSKIPHKIKAY